MTPKEYYSSYQADNSLSPLSTQLIDLVKAEQPTHVLDFGCGTGKHLKELSDIVTCGLDISLTNLIHANVKNDCPFLVLGTEDHLSHLQHFDVVITCSVLDHIKDIDKIIENFKRIAQKAIFLAETNDTPDDFYYPHSYEDYGFEKLDFKWTGNDGAEYFIWQLKK